MASSRTKDRVLTRPVGFLGAVRFQLNTSAPIQCIISFREIGGSPHLLECKTSVYQLPYDTTECVSTKRFTLNFWSFCTVDCWIFDNVSCLLLQATWSDQKTFYVQHYHYKISTSEGTWILKIAVLTCHVYRTTWCITVLVMSYKIVISPSSFTSTRNITFTLRIRFGVLLLLGWCKVSAEPWPCPWIHGGGWWRLRGRRFWLPELVLSIYEPVYQVITNAKSSPNNAKEL